MDDREKYVQYLALLDLQRQVIEDAEVQRRNGAPIAAVAQRTIKQPGGSVTYSNALCENLSRPYAVCINAITVAARLSFSSQLADYVI